MTKTVSTYVPVFLLWMSFYSAVAQIPPPVKWNFKTISTSPREKVLNAEALIAPGWHLYSQFIAEGGPLPTRFNFISSSDYQLTGKVQEAGEAIRYYDDIYDMEVAWYSHDVSFSQRITVLTPTTIKGTIEYMACNQSLCLPGRQEFSLRIAPLEK